MNQKLVSTPIKSMGKVITGRTPSTKNQDYYGDEYFFISPADLGDRKYVVDSIKKLSESGIKKANKLPPNTILFTCIGSTIGKIGMSVTECSTNQQINAVVVDEKQFNVDYVYYQLSRHSSRISDLAGRQAVPIVNKTTFESYEINTHPLEEQKKIAQILSTWDEAIRYIAKLIEKKKIVRNSLIRSVITQFAPNLVSFSDIFDIAIGGTPARSNPTFWDSNKNGSNIWVSIRDLSASKKYISDSSEYISDLGVNKSNVKLVKKGTVIMSFKLTIGRKAICDKDLFTNEAIVALVPKNINLLDEYVYYSLELVDFDKEIDTAIKGKTLNKEKIKNLKLPLLSLQNQSKVVSIFSEIDSEIELLNRKLTLFQKQKNGIAQRLLTGKVRVN